MNQRNDLRRKRTDFALLGILTAWLICPTGPQLLAQDAWWSLEGDFQNDSDKVQLFFELINPISNANAFWLQTFSHSGGTNAVGDPIAAGGFDPILALFDVTGGGETNRGVNNDGDNSIGNRDSWLSWSGVAPSPLPSNGYINTDPLPVGDYRADLTAFVAGYSGGRSPWAMDLYGPWLPVTLTGLTTTGSASVRSLKLGGDLNGAAAYFELTPSTSATITDQFVIGAGGQGQLALVADTTLHTPGTTSVGHNGQGIATILGRNAQWEAGPITVGGQLGGSGLVYVTDQADINSSDVQIGTDSADGTVLIDGTFSSSGVIFSTRWDVFGSITVGSTGSGTGTVTIENDGVMTATQDVGISGTSSAAARVNVQEGGELRVDGTITVGPYGTVSLLQSTSVEAEIETHTFIVSGGTFTHEDGILTVDGGTFDPGTGGNTLDGGIPGDMPVVSLINGATASIGAGLLRVGVNHAARLEVLSSSSIDGPVLPNGVQMGELAGSYGEVIVHGIGSSLSTQNGLVVGNYGQGVLRVHNGGTVSDLTAPYIPIAWESGSTGEVEVIGVAPDGTPSTWTTNGILEVGLWGVGSLVIADGGRVNALASAAIGETSGSAGSFVGVAGSGVSGPSLWSITGGLYVGGSQFGPGGSAELTVDGGVVDVTESLKVWSTGMVELLGGEIHTGSFLVESGGTFTHEDGMLTVDGGTFNPGASLFIDAGGAPGDVAVVRLVEGASATFGSANTVGDAHAGRLEVLSGSLCEFYEASPGTSRLTIGDSTGEGEVVVSDDGSTLIMDRPVGDDGGILVGESSLGILRVLNGGSVSVSEKFTQGVRLASFSSGNGILEIDGVGASGPSRLSSLQGIDVGLHGHGSMTVSNGAEASSGGGRIAVFGTASGSSALVTDPGSRWDLVSGLYVGGSATVSGGTGTLTVSNGGVVDVAGELKIWNMSRVELLGSEIRTGSFLNDEGGTFTHNDGILTVDGGIFDPGVSNYTLDGAAPSGLPVVQLINGAAASLSGSKISIGFYNRARLEIASGSSVVLPDTAAFIDIAAISGSHSELVVDGQGSSLTTDTGLAVGLYGDGALRIRNGGSVDDVTSSDFDNGPIAWGTGSTGFAEVVGTAPNGTPSTWTTHNELQVGWAGVGELSIGGGGRVNALNGAAIAWHSISSNGSGAHVEGSGPLGPSTWDVTGSLSVGGAGGTGTLTVSNGGLVNVSSRLHVWNTGSVSVDLASRIDVGTGVGATGALTVHSGGILSGEGTVIAAVRNAGGTVSPGDSPGTLTIQGSYVQTVSGALDIEIGGTSPAQYDRLDIMAGSAALDGSLDVSLVDLQGGSNVFAPKAGDSFEILAAAGGLGGTEFVTQPADLPALPGLMWDIVYGSDFLRLDVLTAFSADFDRDGDVDGDDLTQWEGDFGQNGDSDANGDGDSDGADFLAWQRQYGSGLSPIVAVSSNAAIPEPGALALLLGTIGLLVLTRRN